MNLFDYIKILFNSNNKWENITNYDKSKNSFMTRRFMSIRYPIQGNLFNMIKTDPIGEAESYRLIGKKFNRVPGWIYTKTKKPKSKKTWNPNPQVIQEYLKLNQIGNREFKEALKFNEIEIKKSIKNLEKQMSNDV